MTFEWETTPEDAFGDMAKNYTDWVWQVAYLVCQARAPEIENWMKANAPWTDRTGNARQTLYAQVIPALQEILVLLDHGVDYGLWLEVANAGRYAIVTPAVDYWAPILMADFRRHLQ